MKAIFAAPVVAAYLARCQGRSGIKRSAVCVEIMQTHARDLGAPGRDPIYGFGLVPD